ncbi:MAG: peptide chain release factor N(5)-glutamine methyltransferase [Armatimonadetes bacterium]|nr:peptide chain release factor N(5)-glutamine methyltransferase [Armatimonadota bacterium]
MSHICPIPSAADESMADAARDLQEAGVERPRFEAQILLAHVLGIGRGELLARRAAVSPAAQGAWMRLIRARCRRVPMAYLLGYREFYGLRIAVGASVLVPRPETELLVERAIMALQGRKGAVVLDVCTGSGCVAAAVAHRLPGVTVVASDISSYATAYAKHNLASVAGDGRDRAICADLLSAFGSDRADVITANPPYVATPDIEALQHEIRDFEPRVALDGGPDGLRIGRLVIAAAMRVLRPGGTLLVEIGAGQSRAVETLATQHGYVSVAVHPDLARIPRVLEARRPEVGLS